MVKNVFRETKKDISLDEIEVTRRQFHPINRMSSFGFPARFKPWERGWFCYMQLLLVKPGFQ